MIRLDCLTDRQRVAGHVHVIKGDVSLPVRGCTLDQGNRQLRNLVIEEFLSVHLHIFYEGIVDGKTVDSGPFIPWIHEDIQPHLGQGSGYAACLRPDCMGNAPERKIVGFKTILQQNLLGTWHGSEVAADQPVDRTVPDIAFRAPVFVPDAKAGTGDNGQVVRRLHALVAPVDGFMQFYRILDSYKRINADDVAVPDQTDGFICTHDFKHNFL